MDINTPITEVMKKKLITLHPKNKIKRARQIFDTYAIHHIPVVIMDEIVGIISQSDMKLPEEIISVPNMPFIDTMEMDDATVDGIMKRNVICLNTDHTIEDAIDIFLENRIHALPILSDNKLVGIVTPYDLLKYFKEYNIVKL